MVFRRKEPEGVVLNILRTQGECNFNYLKKSTGLSYRSLNRVLETLVSKGVIVEKRIGRLRIVKLVESRERV